MQRRKIHESEIKKINNSGIVKRLWDSISDEYFGIYGKSERINEIIEHPENTFHPEVFALIKDCFPDLKKKKICVPGSGDNHVALAFSLLGAQVTSVDLSQQQINNAARIAAEIGLDIQFICDDAMKLENVKSNEYDLVYTSNGFVTYISDLDSMYCNFYRILKKNGYYILHDTHPFMRPFAGYINEVVIKKPYEAVGPFTECFVYHWRLQDIINTVLFSGFQLQMIKEFHAQYNTFWNEIAKDKDIDFDSMYNWRKNKLAALPQWLSLCAKKSNHDGIMEQVPNRK